MDRLRSLFLGKVLVPTGAVVVLALAGLAVSSSGHEIEHRGEVPRPVSERVDVIDLSNEPAPSAGDRAKRRQDRAGRPDGRGERPAEDVSEDELDAVESRIRARTSGGAAAPDDGVSPGAPSDDQVREELRQLRRAQTGPPGEPIGRGSGGLIQPVNGRFTSPFGQRWGRLHAGIDLAAPTGTPIRAAAAGQVILMAPTGGYGNYTCINHGNTVSTCYAHQSRYRTSRGAVVKQGEVVGYVGNTGHSFGAHLHFEARIKGRPVDPIDYL